MPEAGSKIDRRIESLYRLPLSEFTAARNGLAKELRADGARDTAAAVGKLAKPSVAAWLVNQLYHDRRTTFDRLLESAQEERRTVARGGAMSTAAGGRRRAALQTLLEAARKRAEAVGSSWTPALRQRVTHTLEALAVGQGDLAEALGRLANDLEPPGFDALLGTALVGSAAGKRKASKPSKAGPSKPTAAARRRREAARVRLEAARKEVTAARRARTSARKALERAEARSAQAERRARAAEKRAEAARSKAHQEDVNRRKARSRVDESERAVARAESLRQAAERELAGAPGDGPRRPR